MWASGGSDEPPYPAVTADQRRDGGGRRRPPPGGRGALPPGTVASVPRVHPRRHRPTDVGRDHGRTRRRAGVVISAAVDGVGELAQARQGAAREQLLAAFGVDREAVLPQ